MNKAADSFIGEGLSKSPLYELQEQMSTLSYENNLLKDLVENLEEKLSNSRRDALLYKGSCRIYRAFLRWLEERGGLAYGLRYRINAILKQEQEPTRIVEDEEAAS